MQQVSLGGGGKVVFIGDSNSCSWPEMEFCLNVQKKMLSSPQSPTDSYSKSADKLCVKWLILNCKD